MLRELRIQDLGVIDDALLEFGSGLTVVTGETGAGKTMVVTALGLLLGGRGDSGLVRTGAARAVVEGVVQVAPGHPARERAEEAGASTDDDELVLVRSVGRDGRSRAHVGGRTAPIGVLAELGEDLVAVHGQADQWRLRQLDQHRDLVDRHGGADIGGPLTAYQAVYAEHRRAAADLRELTDHARERAQEALTLTTMLERIEAVDPKAGEDVALAVEAERLGHAEELRAAASEAGHLLSGADEASAGDDGGVLAALATARSVLERAASSDPALAELARRCTELGHLATDLASDVTHYLADLDVDPGRLAQVQERRAALTELTRVHGPGVDDVLAWSEAAVRRLATLIGDDERIEALTAAVHELGETLMTRAAELTQARGRAADHLGTAIGDELATLAMPGSRVAIEVRPRAQPGPMGVDEVEITLAANAGADLRSVSRAASGGELSRVMLAIEVATAAASDGPPTFVFDEVDAGVGGRAALAVGARLAALARHAQVIVVTHLAQVAAHADTHLVVHKSGDGQITRSDVRTVESEERVRELARMLGGSDSAAALEHARDLWSSARQRR